MSATVISVLQNSKTNRTKKQLFFLNITSILALPCLLQMAYLEAPKKSLIVVHKQDPSQSLFIGRLMHLIV